MFTGYLVCGTCDYRTEEFMCMHHHYVDGFGVLLQDRDTLALRVIHVPDEDVFYPTAGQGEEERGRLAQEYVARIVAAHACPGERRVDWPEYLREESDPLPCPRCGAALSWETTGIT